MSAERFPEPRVLGPSWAGQADAFVLLFRSAPANVAFARAAVAAFAARLPFTVDEIEDLKLAVSEMVTNATLHAYGPDGGPVWVGARLADDGLEVVVEDRGSGIEDVDEARRPGMSRLGGEHLGIGFSVAESYVDALTVESAPEAGTCVRMFKRPGRAGSAGLPGGAPPGG